MGAFVDIQRVNDDPQHIRFEVEDVDLSIVNALRRTLISHVPNVAFCFDAYDRARNDVTIHKNTSTLHNEFLGHRISLVPVGVSENQLRIFEPSKYRFVLKAKNNTDKPMFVTSADIAVFDHTGAKLPKDARDALFPACSITGDSVLLVKLKPVSYSAATYDLHGEEIDVECTASIGTGHEHARWSPVSECYFRNKQDVASSTQALAKRIEELGDDAEEIKTVREQWPTLNAHRHFIKNSAGMPRVFEFFVKSEAPGLRPAYLVFKALRVLVDRVTALKDAMRSRDTSKVTVDAVSNLDDFYEFSVQNEDHTIGNLVHALLYNKWVLQEGGKAVSYVGYYLPHPLEDRIVFKVKVASSGEVSDVFVEGLTWIQDILKGLMSEWIKASSLDKAGIVEVSEFAKGRQAVA